MAEVMHVKVDDSINLRKTILGTAIDSARLIKQNEEIKEIRQKKLEQVSRFNDKIKQIRLSISRLKNELPIIEEKEARKKLETVEEPSPKKKIIKKELTEIDKLSSEIEQLEHKLRAL